MTEFAEFATLVAENDVFTVYEIFGGTCAISRFALHRGGWAALAPEDIIFGTNLLMHDDQCTVMEKVEEHDPVLTILETPCGSWSTLQEWFNADWDTLVGKRWQHLPLWQFSATMWAHRTARGRLVLYWNNLQRQSRSS